jgi:acyl dehydratase
MRVFSGADELRRSAGTQIGVSSWHVVDQERIDKFAEATGDHQWIHVDPERAATGPFGTTIAHGLLTLSLFPAMTTEVYKVEGTRQAINYGLNKVRFPAPVPVGSNLRGRVTLLSVADVEGGLQVTVQATIEREGSAKPVCVAESVSRLYF